MSVKHRISGHRALVGGQFLVWNFLINFNCWVSKPNSRSGKSVTGRSCHAIWSFTLLHEKGLFVFCWNQNQQSGIRIHWTLCHCAKRIRFPVLSAPFFFCAMSLLSCAFALCMLSVLMFCRGCQLIISIMCVCVRAIVLSGFGSNSTINRILLFVPLKWIFRRMIKKARYTNKIDIDIWNVDSRAIFTL